MRQKDPIQPVLDDARTGMEQALAHLRAELNTIRTGRASPAMLENVKVEYYGNQTPLNQVASISAPQADLLVVQPFDQNALTDIEKGIMQANLGLNPSNDGSIIRVPVPPLSEERRKELARRTHEIGEEAKISIRNTRHHARDLIREVVRDANLSEDARYGAEEDLQELTDTHTQKIDTIVERKQKEIMQV